MSEKSVRIGIIGAGANTRDRHIPGLQAPFGPGPRGRCTVHRQHHLHPQAWGAICGCRIPRLERVTADQGGSLLLEGSAQTREGLAEEPLLHPSIRPGQGDHRLGALHSGSTGPEVGAGMQGGEATVEPGVTHQGGEAIHALQDAASFAGWVSC